MAKPLHPKNIFLCSCSSFVCVLRRRYPMVWRRYEFPGFFFFFGFCFFLIMADLGLGRSLVVRTADLHRFSSRQDYWGRIDGRMDHGRDKKKKKKKSLSDCESPPLPYRGQADRIRILKWHRRDTVTGDDITSQTVSDRGSCDWRRPDSKT